MKKNWMYIIPVVFIISASCQKNNIRGVNIEGEVSGLETGELVYCMRPAANPDSLTLETTIATVKSGGKFTLHIPVKAGHGDWYKLWIGSTPRPDKTSMLYLDSGSIMIKSKDGKLENSSISGSNDAIQYADFTAMLRDNYSEAGKMVTESDLKPNIAIVTANTVRQWTSLHLTSPLGTALLEKYKSNGMLHEDSVIAYLARQAPPALNNLPAQRLKKWIVGISDVALTQPAPEFTLPDTSGKSVSLKDFRGKFLLLDFWASWCVPCRGENPNVLKVYNQYKNKGFDVLGVSLDDNSGKAAWLAAIAKDGLAWTNVSDLNAFDDAAAKLYHVNAIPTNFLISPEGVIVARNLRGEALEKKLAEVLP